MALLLALVLLLASLALGASGAQAAPGAFDTTFGTEGLAVNQFSSATPPNSISADVAIAPDGKIVVSGQVNDPAGHAALGVARYLPSGQLDTSFGSGGAFVLQIGQGSPAQSYGLYSALAVMPDGRIVVAGTATDSAAHGAAMVVRLTSSGALDPTFSGGYVVQQLGEGATPSSLFYGLLLQPDGKILTTGTRSNAEGKNEFVAERFNTNGSPDSTFGTGGVFSRQLGGGSGASLPTSAGTDAIEQPGGFVFSAQASNETGTADEFVLVKLTSGGHPDLGFGTGGFTHFQPSEHPGTNTAPFRVVQQSGGKLVLGGAASFNAANQPAFALARFTAAGAPDPSFGTGGVTLTQLSSAPTPQSVGIGLVAQADGRLVLPGYVAVDASSNYILTVARYTPEGALDPTFATNGVLQRQLGSGPTPTSAMTGTAIDSSGRLVFAGEEGTDGTHFTWLVGRMTLEEPPLPPPSTPATSPGPAGSPPLPFACVAPPGATVVLDAHGNVAIRLSCTAAASGTVTLTALSASTAKLSARHKPKHGKSKLLKLGSATFTLAAGQPGSVKVHLSGAGQVLLRTSGRLHCTATVVASANGQSKTTTASITITAPKHKPHGHGPKHRH